MKISAIRYITPLAVFVGSAIHATAASLTLSDGTQLEGEINKVQDERATITSNDGSQTAHSVSDFDSASQKTITEWKNNNPHKADVHTQWDTQPVIKSSKMPQLPEQLRSKAFAGNASIELILDESGNVIHASVSKSTHASLDAPSIAATREWKFEPAMVNGKAVKSKLRVPFNFVNTVKEPEEMNTLNLYRGTPFSILFEDA